MPNPSDKINYESIRLEIQEFYCATVMEDFGIKARVDLHYDPIIGNMILTLKQPILGKKYLPIEIKYPRDWWQAVKERWWPAWWLKRWPVEYIIEKINVYDLFPKIALPDGSRYMEYAKFDRGWNYLIPKLEKDNHE